MKLEINKKYLLRTHDMNGLEKKKTDWITATWNGTSLVDNEGCTWNEWATEHLEDVFPAQIV